jgi:hypothetical protein
MAASFLKRNRKFIIRFLFIFILLLPLWMWLWWLSTPKRKFVVAIVDKTVLTQQGQEHISLNWVLNQQRFAKNNSELYQRSKDYFGFFPEENRKFRLKGLERFTDTQLEQLSNDADVAYITDAYGIYRNEWFDIDDEKERSGIVYGGMSRQDLYFLQQMKEKHKLIITEFNCLGSPTAEMVRHEFENRFAVKWSGWIGRYFESLDTTVNLELPKWLIRNYKQQHNNQWPFTKSGIAFVRNDDKVEILEKDTHLNKELPYIVSSEEGKNYYQLPETIKYSFWFDIINVDTKVNHVISSFTIDANAQGKRILKNIGIPASFPAITTHINNDYRFFYFSADFCDNPIGIGTSYFKGVHYFDWLLYNSKDLQERVSFFWQVYRPLVTRILEDYYQAKR